MGRIRSWRRFRVPIRREFWKRQRIAILIKLLPQTALVAMAKQSGPGARIEGAGAIQEAASISVGHRAEVAAADNMMLRAGTAGARI